MTGEPIALSGQTRKMMREWPRKMADLWAELRSEKEGGNWHAVAELTSAVLPAFQEIEETFAVAQQPWPKEMVEFHPIFQADRERLGDEYLAAWVNIEIAKQEPLATLEERLTSFQNLRSVLEQADPAGQNPLSHSTELIIRITELKISRVPQSPSDFVAEACEQLRGFRDVILATREAFDLARAKDPHKMLAEIERQKTSISRTVNERRKIEDAGKSMSKLDTVLEIKQWEQSELHKVRGLPEVERERVMDLIREEAEKKVRRLYVDEA